MKILIVEDDRYIANNIKEYFDKNGFMAEVCGDGETCRGLAKANTYEVIILDIMLPGKDGLRLCKQLRKSGSKIPIIMLTAKDSIENRVAGLEIGADDYLVKPFALKELLARVQALVRRASYTPTNRQTLVIDDLVIDTESQKASRQGKFLTLTKKQFQMLAYLAKHQDKVISKKELLQKVRGIQEESETSDVVRSHMQLLRKEVDAPFVNKLIKTVRGSGFILTKHARDDAE